MDHAHLPPHADCRGFAQLSASRLLAGRVCPRKAELLRLYRQAKVQERLEREMAAVRKSIEARTAELAQKNADIKMHEERIAQTDQRHHEAKVRRLA